MRVLRILLRLLPGEFRREYESELLEAAESRWREAKPKLDPLGRARFWPRQWVAALQAAVRLRRGSRILGAADLSPRRRRAAADGVWKDVRHSARSLIAHPGWTAVAVLTLGLGVGATTAMFSAVHAVLFRALPYESSDDIVILRRVDGRDGSVMDGVSAANVRDVAGSARSLTHAAVAEAHGLRLVEDGRAVSLRAWLVAEGFFEAIGARAQLGRTFLPEEFVPGREKVVVLSHATWHGRFGGDPEIVGRELILDGAAHTVVGVLPPEFKYPSAADVWGPRPPQPWDGDGRARAQLDAVARLSPGTTVAAAGAELNRIAEDLTERYPADNANLGFSLIPLRQHLFGDVEAPLLLLLGAVGLVLLIASANVAGLQLARGAGRSREFALRSALGASSRRILRLLCLESLLLAGAGGLVGIALATLGVDALRLLGPENVPRMDEVRIDGTALSFALLVAVGSALIAGSAPALRASRTNLSAALTEAARGNTGGRRARGLRDRLVVLEIGVAVMLTIGAGLLVKSFHRLLDTELGFDPEHRLAAQVWAYDDEHQPTLDFFERSIEAIGAVPGVEAVGLTTDLPFADDRSISSRERAIPFTVDARTNPIEADEPLAALSSIDAGYARAMGVPVVAGRTFSAEDHAESPPVAMVNESFVRRHLLGEDPIGQRITLRWRGELSREIVGVLGDVRRDGFASPPRPEIYVPLSQEPWNGLTFVIETAIDPAALAAPVQEAMWTVDPSQATWATRTMEDLLSDWNRERRFNTVLLVSFAVLSLSLAAVGVYGLMSFSVEQRIHELGVRRALGGQTRDLLGMILGRGLTLALTGVGLGVFGSMAMSQLLRGMLFDIDPLDPTTFIALSAFVIAVGLLAALFPALRATRVDPMTALRME